MTVRTWICTIALIAACGGGHKSSGGDDIDASNPCGVFGAACTGGTDCCSGVCDPQGACSANSAVCSQPGSSCSANTDCCSVSCVDNVCGTSCVADNGTCSSDGECCSGTCASGTCAPLNTTCSTDGNPCSASTDCCSQLCNPAGLCGPSSYCTQDGDACAHDADCCGDICNIEPGSMLGTCAQPKVGGTLCSAGIDGTVCGGCGDCCSRLCERYPPTGAMICQPAEGCRVNGDTCHQDSDCCGAAGTGLPGSGNVVCAKNLPTDPVGVCRNPMSCNPEGDVCHYQNYMTCDNSNARNDCCACISGKDCCQLDALGIPRCNALGTTMCVQAGDQCAYSGDCCNGAPCVPDMNGVLRCALSACVSMGGMCTNSADCCDGTTCVFSGGSTYGTCGGSTVCGLDGQACSDTMPCCDGIPCDDTSQNPPVACPAGKETGCTCYAPIF